MAIISRLAVLLGLDAGEFNAGLGKAKERLDGFASSAKFGMATVATVFIGATKSAADYADKINDVAKANDMSVQSVLRMSQALAINGGNTDDGAKLMSAFSNKVDEAATGSDKAQKAFLKIGVSIKDLKTLSPQDLFEKTVKSLAGIEDTTKRNAMAMDMFGRAIKGVDIKGLAESLDQNKDSFKDAEDAFRRIGLAYDKIDIASQSLKVNVAKNTVGIVEAIGNWADKYITHGNEIKKMNDDLIAQYGYLDVLLHKLGFKNLEVKTPEFGSVQGATNVSGALTGIGGIAAPGQAKRQVELMDSIKKANEALDQQTKSYELEARSIGKVQSAAEKLQIEFEKGGKYFDASHEKKMKALAKAEAVDKARQAYELNKMIQASEYDEKKLELERKYVFASEAERQYQMDIFELEKKITEQKEKGLLVDQEAEKVYREQEMKRIERKKKIEEEQHTFEYGWKKAYEEYVRDATDAAKNSEELFSTMAHGMEDAIANFIRTGKLDFRSFANLVLDEIARIEARLIASKILKFLKVGDWFGGDTSGGGGASGALSSLFTTAPSLGGLKLFADGGEPPIGVPSIVGERGPELFVPRTSGTIIPNNQLGSAMGGSPQVVYNGPVIQNMSAIDTQSAVQFLAKYKTAVWSANQSANRSLPQSR